MPHLISVGDCYTRATALTSVTWNAALFLRSQVKRHLYSSVRRSPALYLEREILDRMHGRLRSMVLGELKPPSGWSPSSEVSLLHGFSQQLKGRFWTEVDCMLLLEGEVIYKFGSIGDRCFFIASGTVEVFRHTNLDPFDAVTPVHDNVSEVLSEGAYFGLTSMFKDICQTRLETVVCCSKEARVLTLSTHSVAAMCDEFPEFQENLRCHLLLPPPVFCSLLLLAHGLLLACSS